MGGFKDRKKAGLVYDSRTAKEDEEKKAKESKSVGGFAERKAAGLVYDSRIEAKKPLSTEGKKKTFGESYKQGPDPYAFIESLPKKDQGKIQSQESFEKESSPYVNAYNKVAKFSDSFRDYHDKKEVKKPEPIVETKPIVEERPITMDTPSTRKRKSSIVGDISSKYGLEDMFKKTRIKNEPFKKAFEGDDTPLKDSNFDWEGYEQYYTERLDQEKNVPFGPDAWKGREWAANEAIMEKANEYNPELFKKKYNERAASEGIIGDLKAGFDTGITGMSEALRATRNVAVGLSNKVAGKPDRDNFVEKTAYVKNVQEARAGVKEGRSFTRNIPENIAAIATQFIPGALVGGTGGLVILGSIAGGQNAGEALAEGATPAEAGMRGVVTGVAEGLLEKMFGWLPGPDMFAGQLKGLSGSMLNNVKRIVTSGVRPALGEAVEEVLIEPITQGSKKAIYDSSVSADNIIANPFKYEGIYSENGLIPMQRMWDSGRLGFIFGGIIGGARVPGQVREAKKVQEDIGKNLQMDLYVGNAMPEGTQSFEMSQKLQEKGGSNITNEEYQAYLKVLRPEIKELNVIAQENEAAAKEISKKYSDEKFVDDAIQTPTFVPPNNLPPMPEEELTQQKPELPVPQEYEAPTAEEFVAPENRLPMNDRAFDNVGDRNVKAFQQEHPEVQEFFRPYANHVLKTEFVKEPKRASIK